MVKKNLAHIKDRITRAAQGAGRGPEEITLICVTKDATTQQTVEAIECGITDVGLNTVQNAFLKYDHLGGLARKVRWHMIGHLQTNKAKKAVEIFDTIQSLDSVHLAEEIDKSAGLIGKKIDCFIEVNIAGEPSKCGLAVKDVESFAARVSCLPHIHIIGLMTIAPLSRRVEKTRPYFINMRELRDRLRARAIPNTDITELSIGMSRDFEVAIEEGATFVRIGTAIFRD